MIPAVELRREIAEVAADLADTRGVRDREPVGAGDGRLEDDPARGVERERVVQHADEWADRAGRVVVLRAPQQERAAALHVAKVDVVAERHADDRARAVDHENQLGLRIVPDRLRMDPHTGTEPHRCHRGALREQLRVRADADLEVLRPHALGHEHVLDARGFGRAGTDAAKIRSDDRLDLASGAVGERGVPARALLDDPLEQARDERDAARLHGLEIARREEPRLRAVARTLDAVGNQRVEATQRGRLTDRGADLLGLGHVQQMAGGRIRARQIHGLGTAHADDGRAVVGRQPGASDQQGVAVPRHRLLDRKRQLGHQSVSSTRA